MIIFGYSSVVIILVGFFFLKISRTSTYSRSFLTEESKNSVMDYGQGWGVVKGDAIGLFFTMFLTFVVFPGMYFSSIVKGFLMLAGDFDDSCRVHCEDQHGQLFV
jgi:hypothetical protein